MSNDAFTFICFLLRPNAKKWVLIIFIFREKTFNDSIHCDGDEVYYSGPYERIIDLDQLQERIKSKCKKEANEPFVSIATNALSSGTQTDVAVVVPDKKDSDENKNIKTEDTLIKTEPIECVKKENHENIDTKDIDIEFTGVSKRLDAKRVPRAGPAVRKYVLRAT